MIGGGILVLGGIAVAVMALPVEPVLLAGIAIGVTAVATEGQQTQP